MTAPRKSTSTKVAKPTKAPAGTTTPLTDDEFEDVQTAETLVRPKTTKRTTKKAEAPAAKESTALTDTKRAKGHRVTDPTSVHEALGLTEQEASISRALWRSLVPEPTWFDSYVPRQVWGYEDLDVLQVARDLSRNVLLSGPTGPGKSHFFRAFGAREGVAVATVACNGASDPALWFGDYRHIAGEWVWVDGIVTVAFRYGGLAFFDEINFLRPEISASVHQAFRERELVLERKGNEVVKASADTIVVGAYNPGYQGTQELNEALKNRFALHLPWEYDSDVEAQLVNDVTLLIVADQLRQAYAEGVVETPVSTNALQEFEDLAASFDTDFAIANFVARFLPEERPTVANIIELANLSTEFSVPNQEG